MTNRAITSSLLAGALVVGGVGIGTTAATAAPTASRARPAPPRLPSDPGRYMGALVRAWGRGDRVAMSRYATPGVVRQLLRLSHPGGRHWVSLGCQGAMGTQHCVYVDRGRHLMVDLAGATESFRHPRPRLVTDVRWRHVH